MFGTIELGGYMRGGFEISDFFMFMALVLFIVLHLYSYVVERKEETFPWMDCPLYTHQNRKCDVDENNYPSAGDSST